MDTGEEGEDTVFQVRGKLFEFTGSGEWAERGIGPFKLNVSRLDSEATDGDHAIRARFIMRAQLTHRVMLNTRVFKEMKLTDGRGNPPTGKTMMFSVLHNGKAVPYLFKVCLFSRRIYCSLMLRNRPGTKKTSRHYITKQQSSKEICNFSLYRYFTARSLSV